MSLIDIDVRLPLGSFLLDVRFQSESRSIAIFGPSGSGKTSLANVIAGLATAEAGHIAIQDRLLFDAKLRINLPPQQRGIGYVFQDTRLFPHLNVKDNLTYGLRWSKTRQDPQKARHRFEEIVDLLEIGALLTRAPIHLSGGEQQRVAIGRALLIEPMILLFDEPLASLDHERKAEIIHYLLKIRSASLAADLAPMITISHSREEVNRLADEVIMLDQGRVTAQHKTPMD